MSPSFVVQTAHGVCCLNIRLLFRGITQHSVFFVQILQGWMGVGCPASTDPYPCQLLPLHYTCRHTPAYSHHPPWHLLFPAFSFLDPLEGFLSFLTRSRGILQVPPYHPDSHPVFWYAYLTHFAICLCPSPHFCMCSWQKFALPLPAAMQSELWTFGWKVVCR